MTLQEFIDKLKADNCFLATFIEDKLKAYSYLKSNEQKYSIFSFIEGCVITANALGYINDTQCKELINNLFYQERK